MEIIDLKNTFQMKSSVVMIFKIIDRTNLSLYPPGSGIWISFFSPVVYGSVKNTGSETLEGQNVMRPVLKLNKMPGNAII